MKLKGSNMPATDISSLLPALGVILPAGAALKEGTLNMDLNISGPLDRLVTTGPVNLSNAKMTGFDLGSKMKVLATFAGMPSTSDTLIQTMASDLRLDPARNSSRQFQPGCAEHRQPDRQRHDQSKQELNFKMSAKLVSLENSQGGLGNLVRLAGGQNGGGIPFRIQGTTSNPVFVPDVAGIAGGLAGQAASGQKPALPSTKDLGGVLDGLFGRKKQ